MSELTSNLKLKKLMKKIVEHWEIFSVIFTVCIALGSGFLKVIQYIYSLGYFSVYKIDSDFIDQNNTFTSFISFGAIFLFLVFILSAMILNNNTNNGYVKIYSDLAKHSVTPDNTIKKEIHSLIISNMLLNFFTVFISCYLLVFFLGSNMVNNNYLIIRVFLLSAFLAIIFQILLKSYKNISKRENFDERFIANRELSRIKHLKKRKFNPLDFEEINEKTNQYEIDFIYNKNKGHNLFFVTCIFTVIILCVSSYSIGRRNAIDRTAYSVLDDNYAILSIYEGKCIVAKSYRIAENEIVIFARQQKIISVENVSFEEIEFNKVTISYEYS